MQCSKIGRKYNPNEMGKRICKRINQASAYVVGIICTIIFVILITTKWEEFYFYTQIRKLGHMRYSYLKKKKHTEHRLIFQG